MSTQSEDLATELTPRSNLHQATMANNNCIADGVPMSLEQMRMHLQEHCGSPVALREQGTTSIKCPCCLQHHDHGPQPGHQPVGCDDESRFSGIGIVVGKRHFVPNCGCTISEHNEENGVNKLIIQQLIMIGNRLLQNISKSDDVIPLGGCSANLVSKSPSSTLPIIEKVNFSAFFSHF